jgi:flagellar basal body-associated protein FliL
MGQQQLLLIILGVIIVGIAIAVGITMFASGSVQANKDAIVNDLNNLAANAYQFRIRPTTMGGGGGNSYASYTIPVKLQDNENATYTAVANASDIVFTGASKLYSTSTVVATLDTAGRLGSFTYTGEFQ